YSDARYVMPSGRSVSKINQRPATCSCRPDYGRCRSNEDGLPSAAIRFAVDHGVSRDGAQRAGGQPDGMRLEWSLRLEEGPQLLRILAREATRREMLPVLITDCDHEKPLV